MPFSERRVDVQQVTEMERDVPWEDSEWMQSRAARPLRLLAEYIEPRDRLEKDRLIRKIALPRLR